jgi:hypothetical protein
MKVRDLIAKLSTLDQDLGVYCYMEDERFAQPDRPFWILDITDVGTTEGELSRDEGMPSIRFGRSKESLLMATLEVTSDF